MPDHKKAKRPKRGHGEGSIRERSDGRWEFRALVGGNILSFYAKTRPELLRRLSDEKARNGGTLRPRSGLRVEDYLNAWLENDVRPNRSIATYSSHKTHMNHALPHIGRMRLEQVDAMVVDKLYATLRPNVGTCTLHRVHATLRCAWGAAVRKDITPKNPFATVTKPKYKAKEMHPLTALQAQHLLKQAKGTRYQALIALALATGARFGELTALQWGDVDWSRGRIQIVRGKTEHNGTIYIGDLKNDNSKRGIPLDIHTIDLLRLHKAAMSREAHRSEFIFTGPDGGLLRRANFRKRYWKTLLKRARLTIRFHDLRHTHATLSLLAGDHPKVVSERLGHGSVQITLDRYSHVLPTLQATPSSGLTELIYGPAPRSGISAVDPNLDYNAMAASDR